ncbi:hypothetical protein Nepgr_029918 [Nepenthes gracilis]|uniref:Chloride conductance regulatory protein ICln n=1 Tax=Nepenthes gracilis TaxID=150966 RepID=A0AAD3TEH5_NEPGR|nr:hypothetical protein Nepgr_029918 [Nepenthes gracilis]
MAIGLRHFAERTGSGVGRPVLDDSDGEELMHVQEGVSIVLGSRPAESHGTIYITSRQVIWLSDLDSNKGYAVDFFSISLHAVSRDPLAYPSPCIYAQIDIEEDECEEDESEGLESEFDTGPLELSKIKEMRLVPSDPSQLDRLFEVFCECAELNPEPVDDEEDHDWVFSADQMEADGLEEEDSAWNLSGNHTDCIGHSNGHHDLAQTVLQLEINDKRFEDAEETERDNNGHQ